MKKQKLALVSLQLNKLHIASLDSTHGGKVILSDHPDCDSKPPFCHLTLTTRPDSLNAHPDSDG